MGKPIDALVARIAKKRSRSRSGSSVNGEGLTLAEWTAAANAYRRVPLSASIARSEWQEGVDPTEHADRR